MHTKGLFLKQNQLYEVVKLSKSCCFAGHSDYGYNEDFYNMLISEIESLILNQEVNEFYVGNYGVFDIMSARAVRSLKTKHHHIKLYLTLPYLTSEINEDKERYYKDFDAILIAKFPESTPRRLGILKCNEYMVNKCDFLLCFVKYSWGGAAKTLEYAQKKGNIEIVNLSIKI